MLALFKVNARLSSLIHRFFLIVLPLLSACSSLPSHGPHSSFQKNTQDAHLSYIVVDLDENTIGLLGQLPASISSKQWGFLVENYDVNLLAIGDLISINIWESSDDSLFHGGKQGYTTINAIVDEKGDVFIPYAGRVHAQALSIRDFEDSIQKKLKGKAVEPQVQALLQSREGEKVSIMGDVSKEGLYPVPISGLHLLDALANAGGSKHKSFNTELTLVRGTKKNQVRLSEVFRFPENNIPLIPHDILHVVYQPKTFEVFGSVGFKNQWPFEREKVSLSEAIAKAKGLNDNLEDASSAFLFRFESPSRLRNAKISFSKNQVFQALVPTIYRLNLKEPKAFFLASVFLMHDKDIIYVANASSIGLKKFVATFVSPAVNSINAAQTLKPLGE